jgi:hypothetical protein
MRLTTQQGLYRPKWRRDTGMAPHGFQSSKSLVDKTIDAIQIAVVAVVLVSDKFLISHSFLKDSAVQIKACPLTAAGRAIRSSVEAALRQAGIEAGDIQLVEAYGSSQTDGGHELLRGINAKQVSKSLGPLKDFDTTGLVGLCGIGTVPKDKVYRQESR